jgi:4-hydroxyphenylpyruvate dioxygenase-like putative hemolysin
MEEQNAQGKMPSTVKRLMSDLGQYRIVSPSKSKVKLPPPDQICIVVKDIDQAVEYYSSIFGWGPFYIAELPTRSGTFQGKSSQYKLKLAFAQIGAIEIELIQVLEGETAHSKFLDEKGEGVHHMRFLVDDLNGILSELAKEGIQPIWRRDNMVLLNSDRIGGIMFELVQIARD